MCIMLMKNFVHLQIMINIADKRSPSSVALNARSYDAHSVLVTCVNIVTLCHLGDSCFC